MRTFKEIALEIREKWENVSPHAKPYLDAMACIDSSDKNAKYYYDSAAFIVAYFLSNAIGFQGDDAIRIKAELKSMIQQLIPSPMRELMDYTIKSYGFNVIA